MKKLTLIFTLLSGLAFAQKLEVVTNNEKIGEIAFAHTLKTADNIYALCFQNNEYKTIIDYKCVALGEKNGFDSIYQTLSANFEKEQPEDFNLNLNGQKLSFVFSKKNMMIFLTEESGIRSSSVLINKKNLARLFGK